MKTPICSFDAKSGILCLTCESKLQSGELTESDVEISIKLVKLVDKIPALDKITLVRGFAVTGNFVLVLGEGNLATVRKDPELFNKIYRELGRKIVVVEVGSSEREMIEDIFYPIKILTMNVVWVPDGSKITKVMLQDKDKNNLPMEMDIIKSIIKELRGVDLTVEFEKYQ